MKRVSVVTVGLLAVTVLLTETLHACSTFCIHLGGQAFVGRNYDFEIGDAMVMVNPSGLQKKGFQPEGPTWTAKFGSITFNQFGRDNPTGGMNEAGVIVELMWLDEARYPAPDARAALGVLEWIQYQLDTAATVADVLASDRRVRINGRVPLHYLVTDRSGRAATIEFLHGRLVAHVDGTLPVAVLTNSTYRDSLEFLRARRGTVPGGDGSKDRFARAAMRLQELKGSAVAEPVTMIFKVLDDVAQPNTRWSIVYDQTKRTIYFRTDAHRAIRSVSIDAFGFACSDGVKLLDIDTRMEGDVAKKFKPYSAAANLAFIARTYAGTSVTRGTPSEEVAAIAAHPDSARCR
jgi:penicillin V acylase-like amidase (Ntn superfamily)